MDFIFYLLFASIGASIGSFSGVLTDRLPRGENIFIGRSHCDGCKKKLGLKELIPILSYLLLRGKCVKCKSPIPQRLFITEITLSLLYVFCFYLLSSGSIGLFEFIFLLIASPAFVVIFFTDLVYGIIPDQMLIVVLIAKSVVLLTVNQGQIVNSTLSAIGAGISFFVLYWLTRGRGMGFGDVKLALVLGFILGFPSIVVGMYGAFLTGAAVSIILVLWGKKKLRGSTIPFGPFLVLSGAISFFWGEEILNLLLNAL